MTGDLGSKLDEILANPAMLAQIKALADTMTQNSASKPPEPAPPPPNEPAPMAEAKEAIASEPLPMLFSPSPNVERNLKNTRNLLLALKPFLDEKRCMKIDKMLSMMRLAEMAGQFGSLF